MVLSFIDWQVHCHLPYHTNRMGMSHSMAVTTVSTPRWTRRAALGLESVYCDAPLWLFQSSLSQCQRESQCQLTEVWLQKGLARDQTAGEGHDGSHLPQNTGRFLFHSKPLPGVDGSWGHIMSLPDSSTWQERNLMVQLQDRRKYIKCLQEIRVQLFTEETSFHTLCHLHCHKSNQILYLEYLL